jgi:hypothetical protein
MANNKPSDSRHSREDLGAAEPSSDLRHRADPLAHASDPLSEEIQQVRNWQEGCSNSCKNSRRVMHAEVLVHRYGHEHHASRYHVTDQRDRHQR